MDPRPASEYTPNAVNYKPITHREHKIIVVGVFLRDTEVKRKHLSSKETQVDLKSKVTETDLTNPEASEKYWEILAGKRQNALQESLDENEKLRQIIEDLKKENAEYKQMLEEANSFVEVIKEELANHSNDTGIDVNDVSTADETAEDLETTKN